MSVRTCPACEGRGFVTERQPLTDREMTVLRFILTFRCANGFSPTYGEIARGVGHTSQSAAFHHVYRLKAKGYVTIRPRAKRSIEVL